MATLVRVTCETCGDQTVTTATVRCRVCIDNSDSQYRFTCPTCEQIVIKQSERRVIDLLAASGVRVDLWKLPRELMMESTANQLNHDDLIDFHDLLSDDATFAKAIAKLNK